MEKKCGVVYKIQCGDCEEGYIGETARPFGVRFREHVSSTRSSTTAVGDHLRNTRHALDLSSSSIVVKENETCKRRIREAIEIHCQVPTLNRDVG